jgi:heme/copper-type cytochrome/quinol oxidase subunit 2
MRPTAAAIAVLAVLAMTGCNDNGGDGSTVESSSPPPSTSAAPSTTPPATASSSCPASAPPPAGATVVTATVSGGKVTTAHGQWSVKLGSAVRIAVTADVADEVHVHGYDKKQDTVPGCPTSIDLTANIPGSVEVELESKGLHLFDLKAS